MCVYVCLPAFLLPLKYMQTNEGASDCSLNRKVALNFAVQVESKMYHIYLGTLAQ